MKNIKLILVVGARPNFMKIAPLLHAIRRHNSILRKTAAPALITFWSIPDSITMCRCLTPSSGI